MPAAAALQEAWLHRGPAAIALWPVSLVYRLAVAARRALYAGGILKSESAGVPVVVVGNVVAGGAGKTPVVMALVRHFEANGLKAGVISRGYGRRTDDCREVHADSDARDTGDEAALVKRATGVAVFVARRRIDAARALLAAHPDVRVIVCDDGLQHYALARDVEICVFDDRGTGNGWLLPAGPLREPWPRSADLVLNTGGKPAVEGFAATRQLAAHALRSDGSRTPLDALRGRPVHAVAAIARPQAFFDMLRDRGLTLASAQALPDHDGFGGWNGPSSPEATLVCTEKDAVKLWRSHPAALAVPLVVDLPPAFLAELDRKLARRGDAKLSSPHGHETS
jgi:tetraacyldisaccharide 4'-kinase